MAELRTWGQRRAHHAVWEGAGQQPDSWLPLYIRKLDCGCLVDDLSDSEIWEPCMAHEADGHLAAISEQDSVHVARCLVLTCGWREDWFKEADAVGAAQQHWLDTRAQAATGVAGSS